MAIPMISNEATTTKEVPKPEKGVTYKPGYSKRTKFVKKYNNSKSKVGQELVLQKERERMRALKLQAKKRQKKQKEEEQKEIPEENNPENDNKRIIYQNRSGNYQRHKPNRSPRKNRSPTKPNSEESPKRIKHRVQKIVNRHRQSQALIAELSQLETMVSKGSPNAVPQRVKQFLEIEEQMSGTKKKKKVSTNQIKKLQEIGKTEIRKKHPKKRKQGYASRDPYRSKPLQAKRRATMPSTRTCVFSPAGDVLPSIKESSNKSKEYDEISALHRSYDQPISQRYQRSPHKDVHPTFIEYHNKHRQRYVEQPEVAENEETPIHHSEDRSVTPAVSELSEGWKYSSPPSSIHPMMHLTSNDDYKINHAIQKKQEQQEATQKLREQAFLQAEFKRALQKAKKQAAHDQRIAAKRAASNARIRATIERSHAIKEARVMAIKDKLAKDDFKDMHKEAVAQNIRKMVRKRKAWIEKVKAKDKALIRKARHSHMQSIYGQSAKKKRSRGNLHHALFDI